MKYSLIFFIISTHVAFGSTLFPNQNDFEAIARMTGTVAYGSSDPTAMQALLDITESEICSDPVKIPVNKNDPDPPIRERKVSFYLEVTGPAEDLQRQALKPTEDYIDQFAPVVQAQSEEIRGQAIEQMCSGASTLDKIQMASQLFGMLGGVYNTGLTEGADPFSAEDSTKNPNDVNRITLQRQYNALNTVFYGGTGFPPVGGVCRHATALVSDFLLRCGLDVRDVGQLAYTTDTGGGHSTVRVTDPSTGKVYFLNWGELSEISSAGGTLGQFDIPSLSIRGGGMFIYHFEAGEKSRFQGTTLTNLGAALRPLFFKGSETPEGYQVTSTYQTLQGGLVSESKVVSKNDSRVKVVNSRMGLHFLLGEDSASDGQGGEVFGATISAARQVDRQWGNGTAFSNEGRISLGAFTSRTTLPFDITRSAPGVGLTLMTGAQISRSIDHGGSQTVPFLGARGNGEIYVLEHTVEKPTGNETNVNGDVNGAFKVMAGITHGTDEVSFGAEASASVTPAMDIQVNDYKIFLNPVAFSGRAYGSTTVSDQSTIAAEILYVTDAAGRRYSTTLSYQNSKTLGEAGFIVTNNSLLGGQNQYQARFFVDRSLSDRIQGAVQWVRMINTEGNIVNVSVKVRLNR